MDDPVSGGVVRIVTAVGCVCRKCDPARERVDVRRPGPRGQYRHRLGERPCDGPGAGQMPHAVVVDVVPDHAGTATVRPDVVTSDTGLPVWPTTPDHPSLVLPDGSEAPKAGSGAALGDDNGLTDSIDADPVPTKRVTRPTRN